MKFYKISEEDLKYLIKCRALLEALESGGVDNWSWYSESRADYLNEMKEAYGLDQEEGLDFSDIVNKEIQSYKEVEEDAK